MALIWRSLDVGSIPILNPILSLGKGSSPARKPSHLQATILQSLSTTVVDNAKSAFLP